MVMVLPFSSRARIFFFPVSEQLLLEIDVCNTWKWMKTPVSQMLLPSWAAERDTWQRLESLALCSGAGSCSALTVQ